MGQWVKKKSLTLPESAMECQAMDFFTSDLLAHNLSLVKISFCFDLDSNDPIGWPICIYNGNWAVVLCAKLWPDLTIIYDVSSTEKISSFGLWARKLFV